MPQERKTTLVARMRAVQSPIIPIVGEWIRRFPDTISLGQGVVYYGPPPEAMERLQAFWSEPGNHCYQPVQGIPLLLNAIAAKLKAENGIEIGEQNSVMVTAGSNMAFMNAILAITSPGDEVILQTPYYFNHEMAIAIAGCRPVLVATDENYQLRPDAIAAAITEKTRAVVTISPNNPTGAVYPATALQSVNQLCRDSSIYHVSDEAYEYFTYDGAQHCSPASFPQSSDCTISLYSLSKAYGFASWRIGYMVMPRHLLDPVKKIQDTLLICPPVVSQYAALGALERGSAYCREHIGVIAQVRTRVLQSLQSLGDRGAIATAQGAFYCFLKIPTSLDSFELVKQLIQHHRVAALPGNTFGLDTDCYLRIAYGALQAKTATIGMERLVQGLQAVV